MASPQTCKKAETPFFLRCKNAGRCSCFWRQVRHRRAADSPQFKSQLNKLNKIEIICNLVQAKRQLSCRAGRVRRQSRLEFDTHAARAFSEQCSKLFKNALVVPKFQCPACCEKRGVSRASFVKRNAHAAESVRNYAQRNRSRRQKKEQTSFKLFSSFVFHELAKKGHHAFRKLFGKQKLARLYDNFSKNMILLENDFERRIGN